MFLPKPQLYWVLSGGLCLLASGCVLAPRGMKEEQAAVDAAGRQYQPPLEKHQVPELPAGPDWRDVLHRAFLANGDLEAAYFDWAAAMARVEQAAGYPNTTATISFQYMFSGGNMKAWDRTTVSGGFGNMGSLSLPMKVAKAGQQALEQARATGLRFAARKFEIQKNVLTQYLDYALMAEQVRIQSDNVALLRLLSRTAEERVRAGAPQQDLLKAQIEYRLAEQELATMQSKLQAMRAMLNGMLARDASAPLPPPKALPAARAVAADDARLIAVATDANPELAALARDVAGRKDAIELARMQYLPDVNPMAAVTGNVSQMLGAMITMPTAIPMIRGQIKEARAMLSASEAMQRQTKSDRAAAFVAALYAMRNAERQVAVFHDVVLPKAEQVMRSSRESYATGTISFVELIDSQRTLLEVRRMIADARIERDKRLAELEALAGVDIETLVGPATAPTTQPVSLMDGFAAETQRGLSTKGHEGPQSDALLSLYSSWFFVALRGQSSVRLGEWCFPEVVL